MSSIFISYRRTDAQGWAGRLGEDLARTFGEVARFFDLSSIPPGADFLIEIERAIGSADAVLVLIGPRWLDLRNEYGTRRLDDPNDVVRAEVSLALTRPVPVIPVLLGGISMPAAAVLPEGLQSLARRNAIELSDSRWEHDRDRLFAALEASMPLKRRATVAAAEDVSVGAGLKIDNSEVGRITGARASAPASVDVLKGAVIADSKVGDITGVEFSPSAPPANQAMTGVGEGRLEQARRQRRLSQFVDRSAEMVLFTQVVESNELPVMVVSAEAGMGKTSLQMRMVHECALRSLLKAELEWSSLDVLDYMSVMRKLRDQLGLEYFAPFTDLINFYTDSSYTPRLDINIKLRGGSIQVAGDAQIAGSRVGDIAGVVLRDNMIVIQRPDLAVPIETRREQLTQRFLQCLATLSAGQKVVLFFSATEKMSEITYEWLWDQLLKPVIDGQLSNVRAILLGQRPPPDDQDLALFVARAQLKPLTTADIEAYIAKRVSGRIQISDERRLGMAEMMADLLGGHPGEVASQVDKFLKKNGVPL